MKIGRHRVGTWPVAVTVAVGRRRFFFFSRWDEAICRASRAKGNGSLQVLAIRRIRSIFEKTGFFEPDHVAVVGRVPSGCGD
jgi:hypothetical protein